MYFMGYVLGTCGYHMNFLIRDQNYPALWVGSLSSLGLDDRSYDCNYRSEAKCPSYSDLSGTQKRGRRW